VVNPRPSSCTGTPKLQRYELAATLGVALGANVEEIIDVLFAVAGSSSPSPAWENRKGGLRLCHGLTGRPYSPHDEDLAFRDNAQATGLGLKPVRRFT
jgi:hypothetical protein